VSVRLFKVICFLALTALLAALPALAETRQLRVGSRVQYFGFLELELPDGWVMQPVDLGSPGQISYELMVAGGTEMKLLLTPFPAWNRSSPGERCAAAREIAEAAADYLAAVAEESELKVHKQAGMGNCLYKVFATDKTVAVPTMEDFKYATQGGVAVGHLAVTFTVLHNVKTEPAIGVALDMLQRARHIGGPDDPDASAATATKLRYPGSHWSLVIDASGMTLEPVQSIENDTEWRFAGYSEEQDLVMTIFFEPAKLGDDPKTYRKHYRKRAFKAFPVKRSDIRESDRKGMALLWYNNILEGGLEQPNVNVFMVRDSVWIDIHLLSTRDRETAERMFNKFINAMRFEE
jgi:hypothetical protein